METAAAQALLVDYDSNAVLLAKDAEIKMHPSSMSKLMTIYVLFQRLKEGRVKLTDTFKVSEKAWRMEGSRSFLQLNSDVSVEDLIQGIIVQSGNDACVVVAEGLSGSEEAFATELNRVAATLGLQHSHFVNSTGWPADDHLMSASDLALLARRLIADFPQYYHYFGETQFTYNGITQPNRNLLLGNPALGVDGLKTGHTESGGYGITLSGKEASGRRLILVVNGLSSMAERASEGDKLLRYGFREFSNHKIATAGQRIVDAGVWMGSSEKVTLSPAEDLVLTLPNAEKNNTSFTLVAQLPVTAPIAKGTHVADLKIAVPGQPLRVVPLVASDDVGKIGVFGRLWAALKYYAGAQATPQVAF